MSSERVPSRSEVMGWGPQQLADYLRRVRCANVLCVFLPLPSSRTEAGNQEKGGQREKTEMIRGPSELHVHEEVLQIRGQP